MSWFEWGMEMARKIREAKINSPVAIFKLLSFGGVTKVSLCVISKYDVVYLSRYFNEHFIPYQTKGHVIH
jgi:hypothetical protein